VLVEIRIFRRDHRILKHLGHLVQGNEFSLFNKELADQIPLVTEDLGHKTGPVVLERGDIRQVGRKHPVQQADSDG